MKKLKIKRMVTGAVIAACIIGTLPAEAQTRKLPDGTVIYKDGTKRLPNGTVIYKDEPNDNRRDRDNNGNVKLPDGSIIYPDGRRNYPNDRSTTRTGRKTNLPPGQAKKRYGGSARDYAYGQNKTKKNKQWKKDNDRRENSNDDRYEKRHDRDDDRKDDRDHKNKKYSKKGKKDND